MTTKSAPFALTMGEPAGIGAEITLAAWAALKDGGPAFFVIDDPARLERIGAPIAEIEDPSQVSDAFKSALPVLPLKNRVETLPGDGPNDDAGAILESIERGVALALEGKAAGVVTNPILKASLMRSGFTFPGHTEYLEALTDTAHMADGRMRGAVMMLASRQVRTVPVTIHLSVKDAVAALRPDLIVDTAIVVEQALRIDFAIEKPRLAISGLNPHAGEDGALGEEEILIIEPAAAQLRAMGFDVRGPVSADTMFYDEARKRYDAALCMLHDQALIPAKTLAFYDGVNITLGLPIIRTSPDHGCALDIAGKNVARPDSLISALKLAAQFAENRASQTR